MPFCIEIRRRCPCHSLESVFEQARCLILLSSPFRRLESPGLPFFSRQSPEPRAWNLVKTARHPWTFALEQATAEATMRNNPSNSNGLDPARSLLGYVRFPDQRATMLIQVAIRLRSTGVWQHSNRNQLEPMTRALVQNVS